MKSSVKPAVLAIVCFSVAFLVSCTPGGETVQFPTTQPTTVSPSGSASTSVEPTPEPSATVSPAPIPTSEVLKPNPPSSYNLEPMKNMLLADTRTKVKLPQMWEPKTTSTGARASLGSVFENYLLEITLLPSAFGETVSPEILTQLGDTIANSGGEVLSATVYSPQWGRLDVRREEKPVVPAWLVIYSNQALLVTLTPGNPQEIPALYLEEVESVLAFNLNSPENKS